MQAPETPDARSEGVPTQTGYWVLFATILASSMAFIDGSALNVALPALQADLQARGTDLLWIVNAYALILAMVLERYRLELVPGHPVKPQPGITLRAAHGLLMTLHSW